MVVSIVAYHIYCIIQDLILTEKMGHDINEACLNLAFGIKLRSRVAGVVRIGLITPYRPNKYTS